MRAETSGLILVLGDLAANTVLCDLRQLNYLAVRVHDHVLASWLIRRPLFRLLLIVDSDGMDWVAHEKLVSRAQCPVIVVSRQLAADRRSRELAFAVGAAAYVHRPYTTDQLGEVLRRVLGGERRVEVRQDGGRPRGGGVDRTRPHCA